MLTLPEFHSIILRAIQNLTILKFHKKKGKFAPIKISAAKFAPKLFNKIIKYSIKKELAISIINR